MSIAMDKIIPDETRRDPDETRREVLTENTAQAVLKHLKVLESSRMSLLTRWIWELLQNARDTSTNSDTNLVASVEYKRREEDEHGELIFQHNGPKFKEKQIAHLIYHGTTKLEDEEMIGQYGSGFLTTHLLSPIINVSGQLEDGQFFQFCLKREVGSVEELRDSMDQAWDDFNDSLSKELPSYDSTIFQYPIEDGAAVEAVEEGLTTLKKCAPFVVAFNKEFLRIDIQSIDENMSFEVTERLPLSQDRLRQVTVSERENEDQQDKVYLLAEAEGEKISVAVPLEPIDNGQICLPVDDVPRLFLGFPLADTEDFSFPAIINSFEFGPTEDRDGVFLGEGDDEVNHTNQSIIKEACELHLHLLSFAASSGWRNTFALTKVPSIREQKWLNKCWLQETLEEQLIEQFRQIPSVVSKAGGAIPAIESILPIAEEDEGVEALWNLLNDWKEFRDMLPRRDEAVGWSYAIKSWSTILYGEDNPISFREKMDGEKMALHIDKETRKGGGHGKIDDLKALLHEDVSATGWLDQFHQFLNENNLQETVSDYHIVLDQDHYLDQLSNLHRDQGISEELKNIAELLEWEVRQELRDVKLSSLKDKIGKGDMKNEDVVKKLMEELQERAEQNPDDDFAKASAGLFSWIVGKEDWGRLRGFPVFAENGNSDNQEVIYLERTEEKDDLPLAPISAWPKDLQQYSQLFPKNYILSERFFEVASGEEVWQTLEEKDFLKKDVIITKRLKLDFNTFLPDEPLTEEEDHKTAERVDVTNIAFLTEDDIGIMDRVRQSQHLARLFWRFLTEWMVVHDAQGLEIAKASCDCGEIHDYFPAEWLLPLVRRRWVPLGERKQDRATAESLGKLLRGIEEGTGSLRESQAISKLLKAIGVKSPELMIEIVASGNTEVRATLEDNITDILAATGGDLKPVQDFMQDMKEDKNLLEHLEQRRERRRMGYENQCLGQRVEDLVRKNLESKGFTVDRTGTGSDFEISAESGDVANLELSLGNRNWLIEVKATQNQEVRMTDIQAKTAVEEGDGFLLCVVPVESGNPELESDAVQDTIRFVQGIGPRIDSLCEDLEALEDLRDDITTNGSSGIRLEVESGKARIRVADSVWEKDGFQLKDLAERLARSGNCSQTT